MSDLRMSIAGIESWIAQNAAVLSVSLAVLAAIVALIGLSRVLRRTERRRNRPSTWPKPVALEKRAPDASDPAQQMAFISRVEFEPQRLLNKSEYKVLIALEEAAKDLNAGLRVMAQTNMGEIIKTIDGSAPKSDCDLAFRSINSKRLDFVVIRSDGIPVLAVEYQGHGHYRPRTFMRDAVKREALRKASISLKEVPAEFRHHLLVEEFRSELRARLQ